MITLQRSLPFVRQQYKASPFEQAVVQHFVAALASRFDNPASTPAPNANVNTNATANRRIVILLEVATPQETPGRGAL
jgi:hypothetical protein